MSSNKLFMLLQAFLLFAQLPERLIYMEKHEFIHKRRAEKCSHNDAINRQKLIHLTYTKDMYVKRFTSFYGYFVQGFCYSYFVYTVYKTIRNLITCTYTWKDIKVA